MIKVIKVILLQRSIDPRDSDTARACTTFTGAKYLRVLTGNTFMTTS